MTRTSNTRVAGAAFLIYIAAGITDMSGGGGTVVKTLAGFVECFSALTLGVTLYAITRDQDAELAMLGMLCRVVEGDTGAMSLRGNAGTMLGGATFFADGSLVFSWLLLRGRIIPVALAWIGVVASALLVVVLPLRLAEVMPTAIANAAWLPMLAFEVPLGIYWLVKRS